MKVPVHRMARSLRLPLFLAMLSSIAGCATALTNTYLWALREGSPIEWNGHDRIELPLVLDSGGRPHIAVKVSGRLVMAMLDTGAPAPTMTPTTAAETGVTVRKVGKDHRIARDVPVAIGPASIVLMTALLGQDGDRTAFSMGQELFSQAVVDIDFDASTLTLIHPRAFQPPDSKPLEVDRSVSRPSVTMHVNGEETALCAILDTGFNGGVAMPPEVATRLALPNAPGTSIGQGFNGRRSESPNLAPLAELSFGGRVFRDVPAMGSVPSQDTKGRCRSLVGMAVLSRHHLIIDMGKKRIWMLPRTSHG
jgi:predicted aspartyl protease